MMDHRKEPDNSDRNRDRPAQSERSESDPKPSEVATGSYYYDDSTGYEVYDDKNDGDEE